MRNRPAVSCCYDSNTSQRIALSQGVTTCDDQKSRPSRSTLFPWYGPRLLLLGDAAFVVRPHTAMGVAKAAGNAMTLAKLPSQLTLPEALDVYDRERRRAGRLIGGMGAALAPRSSRDGELDNIVNFAALRASRTFGLYPRQASRNSNNSPFTFSGCSSWGR
jgi:2-polyprenyl-6-methoxyphenol hydroxylase-like FAD-dependent oxidoreductase